MATVIPAIRARMGNTTYFETKMPARELAMAARPAKETDAWGTSIEERIQRELNEKRVRDQIVPYLVKSADRFFGSIIVLIYKGNVEFEDVGSVVGKIQAAYRSVAEDVGFLTIDGGELVVLDGQHRLAALRDVVTGRYDPSDDGFASEVSNDEVCVIFIEHESIEKTRRIFNKVNRYAKTTSRSDNIITSEDDGYAIVTRRLVEDGAPLGIKHKNDLIVDWKSNTIAARSTKLTTISAVYETTKDILHSEGFENLDEKVRHTRPSDEELDHAYETVERWWMKLMGKIPAFKDAAADPSQLPKMREESHYGLLLRPNGQIALVKGLARAVHRGVDLDTAVDRAAKISWRLDDPMWRDILVKANRGMIARSENYDIAAELIAYLVGNDEMDDEKIKALAKRYAEIKGDESGETEKLPEPIGATPIAAA